MAQEIIDLDNPVDMDLTSEMNDDANINLENPSPPPSGTAVDDSPDEKQEIEDLDEEAPLKAKSP